MSYELNTVLMTMVKVDLIIRVVGVQGVALRCFFSYLHGRFGILAPLLFYASSRSTALLIIVMLTVHYYTFLPGQMFAVPVIISSLVLRKLHFLKLNED